MDIHDPPPVLRGVAAFDPPRNGFDLPDLKAAEAHVAHPFIRHPGTPRSSLGMTAVGIVAACVAQDAVGA